MRSTAAPIDARESCGRETCGAGLCSLRLIRLAGLCGQFGVCSARAACRWRGRCAKPVRIMRTPNTRPFIPRMDSCSLSTIARISKRQRENAAAHRSRHAAGHAEGAPQLRFANAQRHQRHELQHQRRAVQHDVQRDQALEAKPKAQRPATRQAPRWPPTASRSFLVTLPKTFGIMPSRAMASGRRE